MAIRRTATKLGAMGPDNNGGNALPSYLQAISPATQQPVLKQLPEQPGDLGAAKPIGERPGGATAGTAPLGISPKAAPAPQTPQAGNTPMPIAPIAAPKPVLKADTPAISPAPTPGPMQETAPVRQQKPLAPDANPIQQPPISAKIPAAGETMRTMDFQDSNRDGKDDRDVATARRPEATPLTKVPGGVQDKVAPTVADPNPTFTPGAGSGGNAAFAQFGKMLEDALKNPSRYDADAVKEAYGFLKGDLEQTRDQELSGADADAASRGVFYGTPGTNMRMDAREKFSRGLGELSSSLALDQARTFGEDRSRAVGDAFGFLDRGQRANEFDLELAKLAGQLGLAGGIGIDDAAGNFGPAPTPDFEGIDWGAIGEMFAQSGTEKKKAPAAGKGTRVDNPNVMS